MGLTLLTILFLSVRMFLGAKEPESVGGAALDLSNLEETLKKLLEKAGNVPTVGEVAAAGASQESQKLIAEINLLKQDLSEKQKQIEEMKSAPAGASASDAGASGGAGISEDEKAKMEGQIRELQARLSEYEIISEDIADLSFYKEQNAKLQKELEDLKKGGAVSAPSPAAAAPTPPPAAPAPAAPKAEPEIVGKAAATEAAVAPPPPPPSPEAAEPTVTEVVPAAAPTANATSNVVDEDLLAEFDAAVEAQKGQAPADANVDLGQMDMDKMMAEAAVIKTDVPEVDPNQALGTGLDENKLLQEAAALESVTTEDKKLMGEFENFVKKSES